MSAASGVYHSERNNHPTQPLRFLQIWITPRSYGGEPKYGGYSPKGEQEMCVQALSRTCWPTRNTWVHLVGDVQGSTNAPVKINQDCNIYAGKFDANAKVDFEIQVRSTATISDWWWRPVDKPM